MCVSMTPIDGLGELLGCKELSMYKDSEAWFTSRDEIKQILSNHLLTNTTDYWLSILEPKDIWCGKVNTVRDLVEDETLAYVDMIQEVERQNGTKVKTTRSPLRINGEKLFARKGAPVLGEDTEKINIEFNL